jgi:phosphatidylglycerophosphate synthase
MVMDDMARRGLRPALERLAAVADHARLTPLHLTLVGLVLAVGAAAAAATRLWWWAVGLWLLSRLADGLDGVLARRQDSASDLGGFLDIIADFAAYGGFVLGVAIGAPAARVACAALLLAYYLNGSAFLAISGLAEKRRQRVAGDERSLQFVTGLTEGSETITAHAVFALLGAVRVSWLPAAVWVFTALVAVTVAQRLRFGWRVLR